MVDVGLIVGQFPWREDCNFERNGLLWKIVWHSFSHGFWPTKKWQTDSEHKTEGRLGLIMLVCRAQEKLMWLQNCTSLFTIRKNRGSWGTTWKSKRLSFWDTKCLLDNLVIRKTPPMPEKAANHCCTTRMWYQKSRIMKYCALFGGA